jgi:pyridoxal/pyridoxine/pyridoxamine kinase
MGDAGRLYVSPDVIPIYKSMLPYSTIITPNWFEVEYVYVHKRIACVSPDHVEPSPV